MNFMSKWRYPLNRRRGSTPQLTRARKEKPPAEGRVGRRSGESSADTEAFNFFLLFFITRNTRDHDEQQPHERQRKTKCSTTPSAAFAVPQSSKGPKHFWRTPHAVLVHEIRAKCIVFNPPSLGSSAIRIPVQNGTALGRGPSFRTALYHETRMRSGRGNYFIHKTLTEKKSSESKHSDAQTHLQVLRGDVPPWGRNPRIHSFYGRPDNKATHYLVRAYMQ